MGVSQRAFNEKQRKRMFEGKFGQRELPDSVTRDEVTCPHCSFSPE